MAVIKVIYNCELKIIFFTVEPENAGYSGLSFGFFQS